MSGALGYPVMDAWENPVGRQRTLDLMQAKGCVVETLPTRSITHSCGSLRAVRRES